MSYSFEHTVYYRPSCKDQDTSYTTEINGNRFYLVLDGHGSNGKSFVNEVKEKFKDKLAELNFEREINSQLVKIFTDIDNELKCVHYNSAGTTASLVIINESKMFVVTVGDSDIFLFNNNHELTKLNDNHSGSSLEEHKRIRSVSPTTVISYATRFGFTTELDHVWSADGKMNPMKADRHSHKNRMGDPATYVEKHCYNKLAVTRSIGDYHMREKGVTPEPSIKEFPIPENNSQILIGSDGFWDCWSKRELINELSNVEKREKIHQTSIDLNMYYFGSSCDDNTLIHVLIK